MWRQFQTFGIALAAVPLSRALSPRTDINDTYDFVVVGGGQAGLVLGGRLSEDTNHTVLVLESGGNGDEYRERIGVYLLFYLRGGLT
jgi:choline dehydrogenase